MSVNKNNPVGSLLTNADELAAEYETHRKAMLTARAKTRAAADMAISLAEMLGEDKPELSPAVVKVLAKRKPRSGGAATESDDE